MARMLSHWRRRFSVLCISGLSLSLAGCWGLRAPAPFEYELHPAIVQAGPPQPAGKAAASEPEVSTHPEIQINPETAIGYENLAEEFRELYEPNPLQITLADVINQALAHNRAIKIQQYLLRVDEAEISVAKGIYDLLLFAQAQVDKVKEQRFTSAGRSALGGEQAVQISATTRTRTANIGVQQLLPTGGTLELGWAYSRVNPMAQFAILDPSINHALTATLRQPLLQGAGPRITNLDIYVAQNARNASAADLETQIQDQLQTALNQFYELMFEVESYDVQVISYMAALDLQRINQAKVDAGVMAPTEVLQARASAEQRREFVIRARQRVRDAEDRLKQIMFFQDNSPAWELQLQPVHGLVWREVEIDPREALAEALVERPELRGQENVVDIRELEVYRAAHLRKPILDVIGTAGLTGLDETGGLAWEHLETADFNNFSLGLEFRYPFQNRQARFRHEQAINLQLTEEERLAQLTDQVAFDVRTAIRDVRTSRERIEISRARIESERANLEAERKRLDVGVSTSFQVLEFQEDLANAAESYVRAVIDYNQALVNLERARGTILETYGVIMLSPDLTPESERILFPIGLQ